MYLFSGYLTLSTHRDKILVENNAPLPLKLLACPLFSIEPRRKLLSEVVNLKDQLPDIQDEIDQKIITATLVLSFFTLEKEQVVPELYNMVLKISDKFQSVRQQLSDIDELRMKLPDFGTFYVYGGPGQKGIRTEYQAALKAIQGVFSIDSLTVYRYNSPYTRKLLLYIARTELDLNLKRYIREKNIKGFQVLKRLLIKFSPWDIAVNPRFRWDVIVPWAVSQVPEAGFYELLNACRFNVAYIFNSHCPYEVFKEILHKCLVTEKELYGKNYKNVRANYSIHYYILMHAMFLPEFSYTIPLEYLTQLKLDKITSLYKSSRLIKFLLLFQIPDEFKTKLQEVILQQYRLALTKALAEPTEENRRLASEFTRFKERIEKSQS